VQDASLDLPQAHQALVNGAAAVFEQAMNSAANMGGFAARERFPTGNCCGNPGQSPLEMAGRFLADESGEHWDLAQQARWIAEDAIRRFTKLGAGKVSTKPFTEAYLWAGYANRLLGENMCEAVFDAGPKEPNAKYFERAQAHFTNAINMGTGDLKIAGYAGRASVRVWLKNWAGAESDARQVPLGFVHIVLTDPADRLTNNGVWYNSANAPYRSASSFKTWFLEYYDQTGDPRVANGRDAKLPFGNGNLQGVGLVPWVFQLKYPKSDSPYRISSGREMVLIRAEAALVAGDWQAAMTLINSIRTTVTSDKTGQRLAGWTANNITDAWTFLKRERSIELWLEARRMGDLRRWEENRTPGAVDWPDFESVSPLFKENPPSRCMPISQGEIDTNPNI
jgi:hypothetical protein